jgi:hypothetical protein
LLGRDWSCGVGEKLGMVGDEEGGYIALFGCRMKISKYNVHDSALIFKWNDLRKIIY